MEKYSSDDVVVEMFFIGPKRFYFFIFIFTRDRD